MPRVGYGWGVTLAFSASARAPFVGSGEAVEAMADAVIAAGEAVEAVTDAVIAAVRGVRACALTDPDGVGVAAPGVAIAEGDSAAARDAVGSSK